MAAAGANSIKLSAGEGLGVKATFSYSLLAGSPMANPVVLAAATLLRLLPAAIFDVLLDAIDGLRLLYETPAK